MASLFPMVFVDKIIAALDPRFPDHIVAARSLGMSEGADAIGVFPSNWMPEFDSKEIGSTEPTLSRYTIRIQNLRIDADELAGRAAFISTARMIRAILYRDPDLRLALGGLSEEIVGSTERVKIFDVTKQDYLSAKSGDVMMYLCTTEMVFVTETSQTG